MSEPRPRASGRIPLPARLLLQRGDLSYLAVRTPFGPHLTPVVYVLDGERLWVTTSRGSVKARAWRRWPHVAGMVTDGDEAVTFRGGVRTFDAFDPVSWPGALLAGPRLVEAATRFTLKNARFFAGYAVDAGRVPLAWTPPGRLFAAIRPAAGRLLGDVHAPLSDVPWGEWPTGASYRATFAALPRRRPVDRAVPAEVRTRVGAAGTGAVALEGMSGLTVLPVAWRRVAQDGSYEATLPAAQLELAGAGPEAPAGLTVDHASSWRASEMSGMLLQGRASLFSPASTHRGRAELLRRLGGDERLALIRLVPGRIVWWEGWTSGSVRDAVPAGRRRVRASGATVGP